VKSCVFGSVGPKSEKDSQHRRRRGIAIEGKEKTPPKNLKELDGGAADVLGEKKRVNQQK